MVDAIRALQQQLAEIRRMLERSSGIEIAPVNPVTFSPTWTAATVNPAIGNGSITGCYILRGRMCLLNFALVIGSTTTLGTGAWSFSLPFASSSRATYWTGTANCRDVGVNSYPRIPVVTAGVSVLTTFLGMDNANNFLSIDAANPFAWGTNDYLYVNVEYEIG